MLRLSPRALAAGALLLLLALVPLYAQWQGEPFLLALFGRVLVYGIAALALNLLLGYGGMVSFGHALYLGLGAYAVGVLNHYGIENGWLHLLAALGACAVVGLVSGYVVMRTSGIAFIMITLAFAQMFYFLATGLEGFGGDDGMSLFAGSDFGLFRLDTPLALYYTAFGVLLLALAALRRLVHAPFGMVLRGCQANERRMRALGFATLRYRLAAYVLSAMVCGVAGVLLANLTLYVSPSYLAWTTSGELIVMVALGGLGTVVGPVAGALAFLLLEEGLKLLTDHWMLVMGLLIVGVVLVSRRGLYGGLSDKPLRLRAARPLPHPTGEPR
ncbi:branched-chain amino acid ABC transporter permease [Achromobacter ruhlandii]|uniref:branched-chain amino acid ABC transporter permease n=1 Tax=Achromobacter ruhlandii TaxID=72557 RepID=UPI0006BFFC05|nr:branched-chain amino acid ABC transporter permease [Achromobacter ruhlandii]AMG44985.1 branched-chain amino acid ABC transporter permease [Achromobacter xylosoxidans]CUI31038.1 leucine/isoleucine/valine transporter permease subunit [Achromobacter ruhlandii]CUI32193.1 leucine/isoleucine/valine transporter permease subunit [Achromobacter ruhlandii]CUK17799.1 leucine/isoleucine/valine transporter permease subunit [Achromobacter ruhlandii]